VRGDRPSFHLGAEADHLTVGELSGLIKTTLEERIGSPLRVIGQVSNLSNANHWYFSLKDETAVVSCVAWASSARRFGFVPSDGDEVIATGHVSHYPPQGRTQFYVTALESVGAGALEIQFRQLCERLRELGYFDEDRKKPLPVFPRRIAVITSATGAAVEDVKATAEQRCRAVGLLIVDVRVQGDDAAPEVARAIKWVDRHHERLGVEAILVTRGGGSIEDLWAFNEPAVAEAAFACSIPLVAAIGHESDTTIIELVADHRASTPTQAAMTLVPDATALRRQIDHVEGRLDLLVRRRIDEGRQRIRLLAERPVLRDPVAIVRAAAERAGRLEADLRRALRGRLDQARLRLERLAIRLERLRPDHVLAGRRERLAVLAQRLEGAVARHVAIAVERTRALERALAAVDPEQVLARGFTYTTNAAGELIRSVNAVQAGDEVRTHVVDGTFRSVVEKPDPAAHAPAPSRKRPPARPAERPRTDSPDPRDQMDLFGSSG